MRLGFSLDPALDALVGIVRPRAVEEFDPQLLEVAQQPRGEQALPLVGRHEPRDLLLRPVDPQHFAEPGVGARQRQRVDFLARPHRGDPRHPVEFEQADQRIDDLLARAELLELLAPHRRFAAHFGADQHVGLGRDLLQPRLEHLRHRLDAGVARRRADHVAEVRSGTARGDREQLDPRRLVDLGVARSGPTDRPA